MKHRFRTIQLTALVLVVLLTAGCQDKATPTATATTPTPSASGSVPYGAAAADHITALGTIRPAQTLQLSFSASGPVHRVPVRLGTEVKEGELLATLDTAALELELQSAQQEVALRQAALDGLISGSSAMLVARAEAEHAQQVAQAEIALQVAQWELDEAEKALERQIAQVELDLAAAQARLTQAEEANADAIAQAELDLAAAQAQLTQAKEANADAIAQAKWTLQIAQVNMEEAKKANERQLAEVQRTLEVAQIGLAQLQEEPDAVEIELLRLNWERAKNNLWSAQLERDAVKGRQGTPGYVRDQVDIAVSNAEIAVREAELHHQQALQTTVTEDDIRLQQIEVEGAKATLERLQEGVDPSLAIEVERTQQELDRLKEGVDPLLSIGVQQAQQELARLKKGADPLLPIGVQQAQKGLDWLKEDMAPLLADEGNQPQTGGAVAALEAEVELAQLQLEALQAWENPYLDPAPPEEIAQARARLRQAELSVAQLELQLQGAELRAPFDGVVSAVYLRPGEWALPGTPVVEIIDTTHWYVETRNVSELTIGQVQVGQEAQVQVLALRGETLRGHVATISPVAVVQQGDTTYTLMIKLEPTDLNLRPGMNAQVEILSE
jgi:multidrug resistance efflux pump